MDYINYVKQSPFAGFAGYGGGSTGLLASSASVGKFTIDGKTWYYQIEVQNQYGKSEFSEIAEGITRP